MMPYKIVILGNSPVISNLLVRFLSADDELHVGGVFLDGDTGLAEIDSIQPDVIILEMKSPVRGCLARIMELRSAFPLALIIVITGLDPEYYQDLVINVGADKLVPSGELTTRLYPAIREHLEVSEEIKSRGTA